MYQLLVSALAGSVLAGFVAVERIKDPAATGGAIAAAVEGDLKHYLRTKAGEGGFLVDILWDVPSVKADIDAAVSRAVRPVGTGPTPAEAGAVASPAPWEVAATSRANVAGAL